MVNIRPDSIIDQVQIIDVENAAYLPKGRCIKGLLAGNDNWRSPEGHFKGELNKTSDIYSFGAVVSGWRVNCGEQHLSLTSSRHIVRLCYAWPCHLRARRWFPKTRVARRPACVHPSATSSLVLWRQGWPERAHAARWRREDQLPDLMDALGRADGGAYSVQTVLDLVRHRRRLVQRPRPAHVESGPCEADHSSSGIRSSLVCRILTFSLSLFQVFISSISATIFLFHSFLLVFRLSRKREAFKSSQTPICCNNS